MPLVDWVSTVWQTLPRVGVVMRHLRPALELPDVTAIDRGLLESLGIKAVIWDVDGTLMPRHAREVAEPLRKAFQSVISAPGVRHVILSNADETRFRELGAIFPEIPVVRAYATPRGVVARTLFNGEDSLAAAGGTESLPSGARALRKPSMALVDVALRQLEDPPRESVLMVGDQYVTDIAGANLAGIRSLKVSTYAPASFPLPVRVLQYVERLAFLIFHRRRQGSEVR